MSATIPPNVQLTLLNRPENVMLVRQFVRGIAAAIQLDAPRLDDVLTAVSEASNNVVLHAYRGGEGLLEVELRAHPSKLGVVVRDRGCGIKPRIWSDDDPIRGLGLASIQTFTDSAEFRGSPNEGTEVRMEFAAPDMPGLDPGSERALPAPAVLGPGVHISVAPPLLLLPILAGLVPAMAARADFTIDRLAEAELLFEHVASILAASPEAAERIGCSLVSEPGKLLMRIWPLPRDVVDRLAGRPSSDGAMPVIARLADEHHVERAGADHVLSLSVAGRGWNGATP